MSIAPFVRASNRLCLVLAGLVVFGLPAGAVTRIGSLKLTGSGDAIELPIGFLSDDGVTCLQFDLTFDPAVLPLGLPVAGAATASHRMNSTLVSTGLRRVVIYSTSLAPLDGGVIVRFPTAGASLSAALPTLSNVRLVSTTGGSVALTGTDLRPEAKTVYTPVTAMAGKGVTLNAPTGGFGPLSYQWLFKGVAINGATAATYTISRLVSANAGQYSVRISNPAGEAVSAIATLTVTGNNPPVAIPQNLITKKDTSLAITLTGSDTEKSPLVYKIVKGPSKGTLSGTPPKLTYRPNSKVTGSDSFTFRVNDSAFDSAIATVSITITTSPPLPWLSAEVGTGKLKGSTAYSDGLFIQSGVGTLGTTKDRCRFTYQMLTGDGQIIARVKSLQNTGNSSRVGVMIRDSLAANAVQTFIGLTEGGSFRWVNRKTSGGKNQTTRIGSAISPNSWLRLVRKGDKISAYKSDNGTKWTLLSSATIVMGKNSYIGLAVASGSNTGMNTSQFSNVKVAP